MVHASVAQDRAAAARHRAFISAHLMAGMVAVAALPVYLLLRGAPSLSEALALAALVLPMLVALDLSRRGDIGRAHFLSAGAIACLIVPVAYGTGGLSSFAMPWLLLVPIEAAFGGSRRAIMAAAAVALLSFCGIAAADMAGVVPAFGVPAGAAPVLLALGLLSALGYATALALRADLLSKRAMESSRRGEARYRLLAENMSDLITRHTRGGNVVFASPAAVRLTGAEPGRLMGQGMFDRVHVADRPAYLTALSQAASGSSETAVRFRMRRDGEAGAAEYVWVDMRCHALDPQAFSLEGSERQVVAVTRDIGQHVAYEAEMKAAREEADRANQAKTRFLANISHELRTPLNAIIGFSEMLTCQDMAVLDDRRRSEYADLIHHSGLHLLAVVNGILDMSRIESGNFAIVAEPFELPPLIDSSVKLHALKAEQGKVLLDADVPGNLPPVAGDRRACRQILLNLISNAIKFTQPGGEVRVSVRRSGGYIAVTVADNGIGVAAEDLKRLGEPFFQARAAYDRPYEGTGLGLSIVKGLVNLHGGRLAIDSTLGEGTRVTVHLPVHDAECPAPQERNRGAATDVIMGMRRSA